MGIPGSCEGRCGDNLDPNQPCQCNDECAQFGDCCEDYDELCDGEFGKLRACPVRRGERVPYSNIS